jgi:drug/metabolite transporter (DMT)-like permease
VLGGLLLDEPVQPSFLAGGAIVLFGVYLGAVYRPRRRMDESARETARA